MTARTDCELDANRTQPQLRGVTTPRTRDDLIKAMKACEQAPGHSVYQHCLDVYAWYTKLLDHARGEPAPDCPGARIPSWIQHPRIADGQFPGVITAPYLLFHDCGKPRCRVVDAEGRQHFPEHTTHSVITWVEMRVWERMSSLGEQWDLDDEDTQVAKLIKMDMDAHQLTADQLPEFAARREAPTLLLAAVAEVHANAEMFGGFDSDSFKIKAKHLERRGRQALALMERLLPLELST